MADTNTVTQLADELIRMYGANPGRTEVSEYIWEPDREPADHAALLVKIRAEIRARVGKPVPLTDEQLAEFQEMFDDYRERHSHTSFVCCSAHPVADTVPALLAEVGELRTQAADEARKAKDWHDTYQEHAGAVDEFFAEILASLPDVPDMSDAYDGIPRGIALLKTEIERQQHALNGAGQHIGEVLAANERLTMQLAETKEQLAARPDRGDVHALLSAHRNTAVTDNELTDAVMALLGGTPC